MQYKLRCQFRSQSGHRRDKAALPTVRFVDRFLTGLHWESCTRQARKLGVLNGMLPEIYLNYEVPSFRSQTTSRTPITWGKDLDLEFTIVRPKKG